MNIPLLWPVGGLFSLLRELHMLQQNSYFASRYLKWVLHSRKKYVYHALILVLFVLAFILFGSSRPMAMTIGFGVWPLTMIPVWFRSRKKAIKPLVFTARVKRQIVTACVLLSAAGVLTVFVLEWMIYVLIVLSVLTPLTALARTVRGDRYLVTIDQDFAAVISACATAKPGRLETWINAPIEAAVRRYYYNDARRILREHKPMIVIGITGSYGKTSTKYALTRLLEEKYNVCCTPGNFNTTLGVVRTIRENLRPTDDVFIVEMGAKKVGDIREICELVQPDMGIITSVGEQHLDTFKTPENVCRTKFELADAVARKGGRIYLNMDCEPERERAGGYDHVGYGHGEWDVRITEGTSDRMGSSFVLNREGRFLSLQTKLLGAHAVLNLAGAVAVAMDLGVSERDIRFAASKLTPVSHRLELKPFLKGSLLIDDAYNANPAGSLEAVRVLSCFDGYRKILITPGLVELGEREYACNADLGRAAMDVCDLIVFVGQKRSVPLMAGARESARFDESCVRVVSSFREAMDSVSGSLNASTVTLLENDLPDNYSE